MANDCYYDMVAVGPKDKLERLIDIMHYEDKGKERYYIYRVFEAGIGRDMEPVPDDPKGRYWVAICGDVAWSADRWVHDEPHKEPTADGLYVTLPFLSAELGIDFEVFTEESGIGFQEHYVIIGGKLVVEQCVDYAEPYFEDEEDMAEVVGYLARVTREGTLTDVDVGSLILETIERMQAGESPISIRMGGFRDWGADYRFATEGPKWIENGNYEFLS